MNLLSNTLPMKVYPSNLNWCLSITHPIVTSGVERLTLAAASDTDSGDYGSGGGLEGRLVCY